MKSQAFIKLPDGTKHEIKPWHREEPKETIEVILFPKDIEALKHGCSITFHKILKSIAVEVRLADRGEDPESFSRSIRELIAEINCRREHGADGYEHLLFIETELKKILDTFGC